MTSASPGTSASSLRSLAIARHSPAPAAGEPGVQDVGGGEEAGAAEVLGVFEHQEEVDVANQDPAQLTHPVEFDNQTVCKENPGKVHSLKLGSKPEVDDSVLVELAPDVEDGHDHGVHQHRDLHEQGHDDGQEPVEDQHEEVISRPAVKYSCLQAETEHNLLKTFDEETNEWLIPVVVEEIEVDQEVESCLRGEGVVV